MSTKHFLILMRPANILTAIADILAGVTIAGVTFSRLGGSTLTELLLLVASTSLLYGGGVVLNDYFDAELDRAERPERPIPSGNISRRQAGIFGIILLILGITCATLVSATSGMIASVIALLAIAYDGFSKHHTLLGPLTMGLCRSGNLLLGISIFGYALDVFWFMGFFPLIFIAAVTFTSQGEVHGNNKWALIIAMILDLSVVSGLIMLGKMDLLKLEYLLPFIGIWAIVNIRAKWLAIQSNTPNNIKYAVKTGVLSLILLDASYAAGFENIYFGLIVLALLPFSIILGRRFAVT